MHEIVIVVAKYFIAFSLILAAYTWLRLERKLKIQFLFVTIAAAVIALLLAKIGSSLFNNPRPFVAGHFTPYFAHGSDNGFPSDHSLFAATLGFLCLRYNRKIGIVALAIAVLIGASRVAAGVHHVIDIVGAFVFAGLGTGIAIGIQIYLGRKRTPNAVGEQPPQAS